MDKAEVLISVVIPVFNEARTVGNVIKRVRSVVERTCFRHEILVVDGCSQDPSLEASRMAGVKLYSLKKHMGKGCALRAGFAEAKGEIIVTMDSDGSYRPEALLRLLAPILQDRADFVIGSRYLDQKPGSAKKLNAFGAYLFNFLIHVLTRTRVSDSQSGYRAVKSKILSNMGLKLVEYEIESEMLVKAAGRGFRIREVPISFEQRTYGTFQLDPLVDGFKILLSIFLAYIESL
jgi:glycosyltransferase involved in cell wall biosynthesis